MAKIGAAELIASVSDPDTFRTWDTPLPDPEVDDDYRERLAAARAKSGVDESIITGEALVNGARTCIVVGEFSFLGGTIGRVSSERIVRAFERAREQGLPIFASPTSGGTRVQEGTLAFLHLLKIS
ncbi:MAG TPA: carboxyl transferase domain-containing protein, partial [Beutenbergiaceae bacterium]|nr:carboxyl transferase domain-containing protein [Beutenbergiaceae bacterium]